MHFAFPRQFSVRTALLAVAIIGIAFKYAANRYAEATAVRELQRRGAACRWIRRSNGEWAHWVFVLDDWTGSDCDLRYLQGISHTVTDIALQNKRLSNAALPLLAHLDKLRRLEVIGCTISDEGIARLPDLPSLRILSLVDTRVTPEGIQKLKRRWPNLRVSTDVDIPNVID